MDRRGKDTDPLAREADAREKWRGGETILNNEDAPGHTLPESERGRGRKAGRSNSPGKSSGPFTPPD